MRRSPRALSTRRFQSVGDGFNAAAVTQGTQDAFASARLWAGAMIGETSRQRVPLHVVHLSRSGFDTYMRIRTIENRAPIVSSATSRNDELREETNVWWNSSIRAIIMLINTEQAAQVHFQEVLSCLPELQHHDRKNKRQRTAYSVKCAVSRIRKWIRSNSSCERSRSKCKLRRTLPVCSDEKRSVEKNEMTASHTNGGIQKRSFCWKCKEAPLNGRYAC